MSRLPERLAARARAWGGDRVLRRVAGNSGYLLAGNLISALLSLATANLLGVEGFGVLGLVTTFVIGVNRLVSFKMGELVVRYMGDALAKQNLTRAAAVVRAAGQAEAVTSLVTFGLLAVLAPWGARVFVKDPAAASLILFYGLSILGNLTTETANGVLQTTNRFRGQAVINLAQALVTAAGVIIAWRTGAGVWAVLSAYLAGKLVLGIGPMVLAWGHLNRLFGAGWWRGGSAGLPRREMARFAFSTNLSGTINLLARDSELLWVGYFFNPLVAGYFKAALAIVNLAILPINPFISTTYPEINRAVAERAWERLLRLLRRVTAIAGGWTLLVAAGLLALGRPLLFQPWQALGREFSLYPGFDPAYPVLLILLLGYGVANTFFWSRLLLLAVDEPGYALRVSVVAMVAKIALAFLLNPRLGYLAEAWLLTGFFLATVGLSLAHGLRTLAAMRQAPRPVEEAA